MFAGAVQAFTSAKAALCSHKAKVASLLQMDANKKLVQQQISQESGKESV